MDDYMSDRKITKIISSKIRFKKDREDGVLKQLVAEFPDITYLDRRPKSIVEFLDVLGWKFLVAKSGITALSLNYYCTPLIETTSFLMSIINDAISPGSYIKVVCNYGDSLVLKFSKDGFSITPFKPILRFAPTITPYGLAHVGHVWLCYVNMEWAKHIGGEFHLDYETSDVSEISENDADKMSKQFIEDLLWAGIKFDAVHKFEDKDKIDYSLSLSQLLSSARPPAARSIMYRAVRDNKMNFDVICRGDDLLASDMLYEFFSGVFNGPHHENTYIPCVNSEDGNRLGKSDVATRPYCIKNFRENGWSPADIKEILMERCLKNYQQPIVKDGCINFSNFIPFPRVLQPYTIVPGVSTMATCSSCGGSQQISRWTKNQIDQRKWLVNNGWSIIDQECLCPKCNRTRGEF